MSRYAKAIIGAVVAGLTAVQIALDDQVITTQEGIEAGIAFLAGLALIWAVPNSEKAS